MPSDTNEAATLTGLAIGDSLGMPFETHHFTSDALMEWDGSFQSGATNEIQSSRLPGEWTDDTKMALALTRSLIENGTYSPSGAAAHYVEWFESGDHRGIGKTTRMAMERILSGHHWATSGIDDAQGNGTAMRVAPIGLYFRSSLETVGEFARIDARITHRSLEAEEGSAAVAIAVALLSTGTSREDLIYTVPSFLYQSNILSSLEEAARFMGNLPKDPNGRLKEVMRYLIERGTGARVIETVPAAFLCFLSTPTFKDAVELAVRVGGDTDTTAAITGALAGSYYGTKEVNPHDPSRNGSLEEADLLVHLDHVMWLSGPKIPPIRG